jgi:Kef-type K+ transport system membrane component KefB
VLTAAMIGTRHAGHLPLAVVVLLVCGFAAVMLGVVRPPLHWWTGCSQAILFSPVPVAFVLTMASAWVTAELGLHPVFGALLAGLTMRANRAAPDPDVLRSLDQAGNLLLPLFFVVTGLSLNIGSLRGSSLALLVLVIVVATVGKLGPGYGISRACGLSSRDSARIAALVNTRGLTELIALNVGLTNGLISPRLFTVLVLMAQLTTLTTGPLLSLIQRRTTAPRSVRWTST